MDYARICFEHDLRLFSPTSVGPSPNDQTFQGSKEVEEENQKILQEMETKQKPRRHSIFKVGLVYQRTHDVRVGRRGRSLNLRLIWNRVRSNQQPQAALNIVVYTHNLNKLSFHFFLFSGLN